MAIPPTPKPAANAVMLTSNILPMIANTPIMIINIFRKSVAKGINWSSSLDSVLLAFVEK